MSDDEPVPKLPRGRGMKFSGPEMFRIAITIALLVAVVVLTKPCSHAVSTFVMGFDGSAKPPVDNGFGSAELIPLRGLSEQQIKSTVEHAQLRGRRLGSGAELGSAANVGSATAAGSAGSAAHDGSEHVGSAARVSSPTHVGSAANVGSAAPR